MTTETVAANPRPSRPWRLLGWMGAILIALVMALVIAVAGALNWLGGENGIDWMLQRAPGLTARGVQGTPWDGELRIAELRWAGSDPSTELVVDDLRLRNLRWVWQPSARVLPELRADSVSAAKVTLRTGPESTQPLSAPTSLRLPVQALIEQLQVGELQIDAWPTLRQIAGRVQLGADAGAQHRVEALQLQVDRLRVRAQARVGADAPLPVQASLQIDATDGPAWSAVIEGRGPLAQIDAMATLRGQLAALAGAKTRAETTTTLDAKARIEPFAAWPLASLDLAAQGLDLSALASTWPSTRLSARAQLRATALDQPAALTLLVDNAAPGRWDSGQLPLAALSLDLSATPRALQQLEVRRLEARLADERQPAGRISGQGKWVDDALQLRVDVLALQPDRLDSRAAAISVSGPVNVTLTGLPQLQLLRAGATAGAASSSAKLAARIEAALTGQMQAAPQRAARPVKLELLARAGHGRIEIERALASDGDASASASLNAQRRSDGWAITGRGEVRRFDPLPWWRGSEGSAWRRGPYRFDGNWSLEALLPGDLLQISRADYNADMLREWRGQARVELRDSLLAGVRISADAGFKADGSAVQVEAKLSTDGDNRLALSGRWHGDPTQDRWQLDLNAPALGALAPWSKLAPQASAIWPAAGAIDAQALLAGRWPTLSGQGRLRGRGLRNAAQQLGALDSTWQLGTATGATWDLQLDAADWRQGAQRIDAVGLQVTGTAQAHRLTLQVDSPVRPPTWAETLLGPTGGGTRAQLQAEGSWRLEPGGGSQWTASAAQLQLGARPPTGLDSKPAASNGATDKQVGNLGRRPWFEASNLWALVRLGRQGELSEVSVKPGRALLPGGAALNWSALQWTNGPGSDRVEVQAQLETLAVAPLLAQLRPDFGWTGDLRVGAHIAVHAAENFDTDIVFERVSGDLGVSDESGLTQALGLSDLRLGLTAHDGVWQFTQAVAGKQLGEMAGAQVMRTDARSRWPAADTALEGVLEMRVANLGAWGAWVPPGWRLGGYLRVGAELGGRFGAPELRGQMHGAELAVRNVLHGVSWTDGALAATLDGAQVQVQTFTFKGGEGTLALSGGGTLGDTPGARLTLKAERFRLLGRIDRRLVASGEAELNLRPDRLTLDGQLNVDEGLFDFSRSDAPTLDSDVTIVGRRDGSVPAADSTGSGGERAAAPGGAVPLALRNAQVALRVGLGDKLSVRGRGLDTLLRGDLRLTSPGGRLAVNGSVRTQAGTYVAYGQTMEIERGEVSFSGSIDNPRLDIRAVRPNLDVLVGVAVTGTTAFPRVRLFSQPEMSNTDKLSWLVLGRGPSGLGRTDTALLQRAAVALLSGEGEGPTDNLIKSLGLTDFSLRQSDTDTRETVVSLGRQVSRRLYLGYERSVNATTGTWQLIYRIAQRFTLRAQSGQENALDLIWSWRW